MRKFRKWCGLRAQCKIMQFSTFLYGRTHFIPSVNSPKRSELIFQELSSVLNAKVSGIISLMHIPSYLLPSSLVRSLK